MPPADLPIACSLSATDLNERLAEMAAVGRAFLVSAEVHKTRGVLRFAAGAGVRDRVEAIVAAESECCPFMTMRLSDRPDAIVLTVDVPEGAEGVVAELVDAFGGPPPTR